MKPLQELLTEGYNDYQDFKGKEVQEMILYKILVNCERVSLRGLLRLATDLLTNEREREKRRQEC